MARSITVTMTSDKSGTEIPVGTGARIRVLFYEQGRMDMRADLTDAEVEQLVKDYKLKPVDPRPNRKKRVTL